jgi:riboflavin synthase
MFTGIVSDIGEITSVTPGDNSGDRRFVVRTRHDMTPIAIGASIACSGCCLTVVEKGADWFAVEVSGESLAKTHLGDWKLGSRINLERSSSATSWAATWSMAMSTAWVGSRR